MQLMTTMELVEKCSLLPLKSESVVWCFCS